MFQADKYKKKRRDCKQMLLSIRHKEWKRQRNRERLGIPLNEVKRINREETKFALFAKIKAPAVLNLIDNTDETLKFIEQLNTSLNKSKPSYVRLRHVKSISEDAILLLLSNALEFKDARIKINGNKPINHQALSKIEGSGFFKILYGDKSNPGYSLKDGSYYVEGGKTMYTHGTKNVDSELTAELIGENAKFIWGEKRRCKGVQRIFIELMQNTNNHASRHPGEKFWWINVAKLHNPKRIAFSFIDYGMGIFNSLETKGTGNKWYGWAKKIKSICDPENHVELLKMILNGTFHRTVTGNYYRGKGIPGIYNEIAKQSITKLIIISNDVYADAVNNIYKSLSYKMRGTFVYFEIDSSCKNLDWI